MNVAALLNAALSDRYAIEREIGAGGMATVYLARDLKHQRNVALKVLKADLGVVLGVDRFLSEIRVTANLQHPNLLPLFDSGEAAGLLYYVMPFVEGETLRHRLEREKQLPVDEALHIASAIASALDYAHRHGVIHRDLKPENILLHEGQPLVADFGIALAVSNAGGNRITQTGLSLGTPQYMSPEQATGDRVIDARTDIYSLGAMTYEMLVGDPPHAGSTSQAIIAKVLTERPGSIRTARPSVPENVDAAVQHALEKLPADRFGTAHEFAAALTGKVVMPGTASRLRLSAGGETRASPTWRTTLKQPLTLALMLLGALGMSGTARYWLLSQQESPRLTVRFKLDFEAQTWVNAGRSPFVLSPDGRLLAYLGASGSGARRLFVRPLGELRARELAGTEGATNPFFSPDGDWIGFNTDAHLKKVASAGGTPVVLADLPRFAGASWTTNDRIVASTLGMLVVIPAAGGAPRPIATPDTTFGEGAMLWPLVLPDGNSILYTSWPGGVGASDAARIGVASVNGKQRGILDLFGSAPQAVLDGWLIYGGTAGTIMAVAFDPGSLRVTGTPTPVIDGMSMGRFGEFKGTVSPAGSVVYISGGVGAGHHLMLGARGSATRPMLPEKRPYAHPRYSPDGRQLAMAIGGERTDIWILDLPSGPLRRLTSEGVFNDRPEWTTDGRNVLFRSNRGGRNAFWSQPADGNRAAELFYSVANAAVDELGLSPDGAYMIVQIDTTACNCLGVSYFRRVGGDSSLVSIGGADRNQHTTARVSPDGRWVAYGSQETDRSEVYVKPFPSLDRRHQVSLAGGGQPVWSGDGRRLYYIQDGRLLSAALSFSPSFSVISRDTVFDHIVAAPLGAASGNHANYDVAPDGKSIVYLSGGTADAEVIVIHDWKQELRARMAAARKR